MMKHLPRILMLLGIGALLTLFFFPMWYIDLFAPQYPKGVTLYIWINKLEGAIQNINILNHYVGMKHIEPDSISELKYFPYVIIGMAVLALITVVVNKRQLYLAWAIIFIILAGLGIYDFYLWLYDYGHSLSPAAPIKIPGASFQPRLLGTKQIVNFTAKSYPHISGYFAGLSIFLALAAWWIKARFDKKE